MTPTRAADPGKPQSSLFASDKQPDAAGSGWITAFTDGGSRGNPGPAGYGVVLCGPDGATLAELSEFLGMRTNNFAEYSGMLAALDYALTHRLDRLRIISDSELMVKQMRGQYRVQSPDLRPLYEEARRKAAKLAGFQIEHVLRGKNKRADELANRAMDKGMGRGLSRELGRETAGKPVGAPDANASGPAKPPVRPLRGIVKEGKISLLEGSIPDGTIVVVMPEKALVQGGR